MENETLRKLIHDSSNALAVSLGMVQSAKRLIENEDPIDRAKLLEKLEKAILSMQKQSGILDQAKIDFQR
jgi:hypothetical protein